MIPPIARPSLWTLDMDNEGFASVNAPAFPTPVVLTGLVPVTHAARRFEPRRCNTSPSRAVAKSPLVLAGVGGRDKPGHDG